MTCIHCIVADFVISANIISLSNQDNILSWWNLIYNVHSTSLPIFRLEGVRQSQALPRWRHLEPPHWVSQWLLRNLWITLQRLCSCFTWFMELDFTRVFFYRKGSSQIPYEWNQQSIVFLYLHIRVAKFHNSSNQFEQVADRPNRYGSGG